MSNKKKWTSKSFGSKLQHNIFYLFIRIGGRRLAYLLLYFVVFYYLVFSPQIRKKASYYIKRRFPKSTGFEKFIHTHRIILEFGKILVDRAIVGILGVDKINVTLRNREILEKYKHNDKGFVIMMSHVGCWQVALSALSFLKKPVNLLLQREEGDVDRHYFEHQGKKSPYNIINPDGYLGGVLEMIGVLKNGEVLCVMGDRVLSNEKNIIPVKFLGENVDFPYSAYKIASAAQSKVVVLFAYKIDESSYELDVASVIEVPQDLPRFSKAFYPYAKQYVESLEKFTEKYPYQFFNFYNMWS